MGIDIVVMLCIGAYAFGLPDRARSAIVSALVPAGAVSTSLLPGRPVLDDARATRASVVVLGRDAQDDDDVAACSLSWVGRRSS